MIKKKTSLPDKINSSNCSEKTEENYEQIEKILKKKNSKDLLKRTTSDLKIELHKEDMIEKNSSKNS